MPPDVLLPLLIGIALPMDCFAVSLAIGTAARQALLHTALIIAFSFGFFQAGMTLPGWAAGAGFAGLIAGYDHWIAFLLLVVIGIRMIRGGLEPEEEKEDVLTALQFMPVLVLSVATSIDALAAGVSFAFLHREVLVPALITGLAAFLISCAGVMTGMRLKSIPERRIEIAGGIILILIGTSIVISHFMAG
jgi:putative Mn2+ efflux pump MntP